MVTLLVILGVLAGPSVVTCFNSPDGMGQCLRGRMVDAGLVPPTPATAIAEAQAPVGEPEDQAAPAEPVEPAPGEPAVGPAPELDVASPAPATAAPDAEPEASVDEVVAATFGLLRAEPDGSVVIAGAGEPGSTVKIFADGELLGSTEVEASGDWVFVPEEPLPPGGVEITLGAAGSTDLAAESFIVVIDDDKTEQPLVVASTPGQASEVLQGLAETAASTEPDIEVAQADRADEGEIEAEANGAPVDADATVEPAVPEVTPQTPTQIEPPAEVVAPEPAVVPEPAAAEPASAEAAPQPTTTTPTPATLPGVEAETAPILDDAPEPADEPVLPPVEPAESDETTQLAAVPSLIPETQVAPQPEATSAADAQPTVLPPTIDAIEIEGDRTFFAGAGPDGGTVRLYVDDTFVADATVSDGRWLVEAGPVLDDPSQRVRADLLNGDSAEVAARAEVNFVVELPEDEAQIDVAQADAPPAPSVPAPQPTPDEEPAIEANGHAGATNDVAPELAAPEPQSSPQPAIATQTEVAPSPETTDAPVVDEAPAATVEPAPTMPVEPAKLPETVQSEPEPAPTPAPEPAASPIETPAPAASQPDVASPSADEPTQETPALVEQPAPDAPVEPAPEPQPAPAPAAAPADPTEPAVPVEVSPTPQPAQTSPEVIDPADEPATPVSPVQSPATPETEELDATPATEAEPEVPTMVAVSLGNPDDQRFVSGKAIIRRGDNLWTIARRVYGEGIRYTTIYDANTGQIRDPDRIYPGQVFDLPENQ